MRRTALGAVIKGRDIQGLGDERGIPVPPAGGDGRALGRLDVRADDPDLVDELIGVDGLEVQIRAGGDAPDLVEEAGRPALRGRLEVRCLQELPDEDLRLDLIGLLQVAFPAPDELLDLDPEGSAVSDAHLIRRAFQLDDPQFRPRAGLGAIPGRNRGHK